MVFSFIFTSLVFLAALSVTHGQLTTSLFIPGFDPQPLSADIVGVSDGQTTWRIQKGVATNGEDDSGFIGTATLVQASDHVHLTYANPALTMGIDCSLQGNLAICTGAANGQTVTETETATPILVQIGSTAVPSALSQVTNPSNIPGQARPSPSSSSSDPSTPQPSNSAVRSLIPYAEALAITWALVALT